MFLQSLHMFAMNHWSKYLELSSQMQTGTPIKLHHFSIFCWSLWNILHDEPLSWTKRENKLGRK